MFQNSFSYVEFEGVKNPNVLEVFDWSCVGLWRFLTGVLVPDQDGDESTMSQTTYDPKSASYIEFKGAKTPHVREVLGWSCGGPWRFLTGNLILIMMETGQQCPKQPMFQKSAFYFGFKGANTLTSLKSWL